MIWILIFVVATGSTSQTGSAAVTQEFSGSATCEAALSKLQAQARASRSHVLVALCTLK